MFTSVSQYYVYEKFAFIRFSLMILVNHCQSYLCKSDRTCEMFYSAEDFRHLKPTCIQIRLYPAPVAGRAWEDIESESLTG